jgi:hypothetical protein
MHTHQDATKQEGGKLLVKFDGCYASEPSELKAKGIDKAVHS